MLPKIHRYIILTAILCIYGCSSYQSSYQSKAIPFSSPTTYPIYQMVRGGLEIGSHFLITSEDNKKDFGADLTRANLLPVEVIFSNPMGSPTYTIDRTQIFAVDYAENYWKVLEPGEVADHISHSTIAQQYAKNIAIGTGVWAGAGGAMGTALGTALGRNPMKGALRGAIAGGLGGGVAGALKDTSKYRDKIAEDIGWKTFSSLELTPGYKINKFIFFPQGSYKYIEMQIRDSSGLIQKVYIYATPPGE
ncbi:MAG TPA: hypothetical protein ACFYEM_04895 [Candidatus Hypogeohydataceae bacterium YC40]